MKTLADAKTQPRPDFPYDGLTKLEYFAAHALNGLNASVISTAADQDFLRNVEIALLQAELLISKLNEKQGS
jgi:hypothetical protein